MTGSILFPKVSLSIDASEMISRVNMVATYLCFNLKSRHCLQVEQVLTFVRKYTIPIADS